MSYTRRSRKPARYVYKYRPEEIVNSLPRELQEIIWSNIPKTMRPVSKTHKVAADKLTTIKYNDDALRKAVLTNDHKFVQVIANSGQILKKRWKFEANNIMWDTITPQVLKILMPYIRNPQSCYYNCIFERKYDLACVLVNHPSVNPNINVFWPEFNPRLVTTIILSGKMDIDSAAACELMSLEDDTYIKMILKAYATNRVIIGVWIQCALKYNRYDNAKLLAEYL